MTRWFAFVLFFLFGLLLGLSTAPLVAKEPGVPQQFYLGVLGNILAAVIVFIGFWVLNFIELRTNPIRKFFGIRPNTTFRIFVGHLAHPHVSKGLAGVEELNEAQELRTKLQSSIPGLGDVELLRRLKLMDVDTQVVVANVADDYAPYLSTSLVTIGSGESNGMSKTIEEHLEVRLDYPAQKIKIKTNEIDSQSRGLVVCKRNNDGSVWFYTVGQTEPDTAASARFLKENWIAMSHKYSQQNFYYLLDTSRTARSSPERIASVIEDSAIDESKSS